LRDFDFGIDNGLRHRRQNLIERPSQDVYPTVACLSTANRYGQRLRPPHVAAKSFVLQIERLNKIHDEIGWIFASLFDERHLDQMFACQKENHLAILAT
jgi:hypothetical protein